jgi:hypothetical protein
MASSGEPLLSERDVAALRKLPLQDTLELWADLLRFDKNGSIAEELGKKDRFFLLSHILGRKDVIHPWIYARCREVEAAPDGHLDLWAREHYKSTIITFAGIIQEVICDPEITICIFSFTNPVATKFLVQIKRELEVNETLKALYSDVLWSDPKKDSPRWSEEGGLIVRRKSNPKEATIEAHGLVDNQPTSAHYALRVYDDVVTDKSVTSPEMVKKTTDAWALSDNLGARGPDGHSRAWHIGTRYTYRDTYEEMLERKAVKLRMYPATDNGQPDGNPVFLSPAVWAEKKRVQRGAILAAQMLQNPTAGDQTIFSPDWFRFQDVRPATLNVYIMCDPASSRKKSSDRSAIVAIGIDAASKAWFLDGYCHKMSLAERWDAIKGLRKVWMRMPGVQLVKVGYERYGMTSDLEHFEFRMEKDKDAFEIVELAWPRDGEGAKEDRIQRLEPMLRSGSFIMPAVVPAETANQRKMRESGQGFRIFTPVRRRDEVGEVYSLNQRLLDELIPYPFSKKDDLADVVSRIFDMDMVPPVVIEDGVTEPETFSD